MAIKSQEMVTLAVPGRCLGCDAPINIVRKYKKSLPHGTRPFVEEKSCDCGYTYISYDDVCFVFDVKVGKSVIWNCENPGKSRDLTTKQIFEVLADPTILPTLWEEKGTNV